MAVSLALGLPLEAADALAGFNAIHRRSQVQDLPSGVHLLNDCYNANPGSMATALATLAELKGAGRAAAALADMLELGQAAPGAHRELGRQAAAALDFLVIYGQYRDEVAVGGCRGRALTRRGLPGGHPGGGRRPAEGLPPAGGLAPGKRLSLHPHGKHN